MPNRFSAATTAFAFLFQSVLSTFPTLAAPDEPHPPPPSQALAPRPLASKIAKLDALNPSFSFAGVEVFLRDDYRGRAPITILVDCYGEPDTPSLAIDATSYGPNARLLNLTLRPEHACSSYMVAQVNDTPASVTPDNAQTTAIAVSVHHSGLRPTKGELNDPAVFIFNPVHGNWTEAKPFAPATRDTQRVYATLAEQNQRIIGGVIALPNSLQSEPASNSPSSLAKPLEQINPTSGYLAIDRIEPDSRGAYTVNLPLLLRPSRGPGPSFSIRYSSQGAPGVLGRGWDLFISTIDVRGPSPLYHPAYETEDYVLDGMDLIALDANGKDMPSLYKGGPIIPRIKTIRLFRLRNNSGGLIVRRYGDSPDSYFWEVWDPNSHVTRLYGSRLDKNTLKPILSTENGVLQGTITGNGFQQNAIGQWGLTQEFDNQPARNGAQYVYNDNQCDPSWGGGDCRAALRLDWVEYNQAFGPLAPNAVSLSGITRVKFWWDKRIPQRFNSDGRLGFLRAQEYWLKTLDVLYQPEQHNLWLAGLAANSDPNTPVDAKQVLFARHRFALTKDNTAADECMNFDKVLDTYEVDAHPKYDENGTLATQTFHFDYEGQQFSGASGCKRPWPGGEQPKELGTLPADAPAGNVAFPAGLLKDLGFGLLTSQSLLGTSRTEETGASIYVGLGLAGDTSSKEITVGIKGGANFTKTMGNSTLVDVTGDGVDDIVYRDGSGWKYCSGARDPDGVHAISYPKERCGSIEGIDDFSVSSAATFSAGVEVYPGFTTFAGIGFNGSNSESYVYFTDRDGDGLVDVVSYGQVFYGLGEDKGNKVVRFARKRGLTPPIPGNVAADQVSAHFPVDVKETIKRIETRLEATSRRLHELEYSQTTIAWEAPLDGVISIAGVLKTGISKADAENAGALGSDFGPQQFKELYDAVNGYQTGYIDRRERCELWSGDDRCHEIYSNPFGPHYQAPKKANISFITTPDPETQLQLALSRRQAPAPLIDKVVACSNPATIADSYDLSTLTILPACRLAEDKTTQLRVKTGDVLYLTYRIHPHFRKWLSPTVRIAYDHVDDDPVFTLFKSGDPQHLADALNCKWKDETEPSSPVGCLLAKQTRYEFDLQTGAITSSPGTMVELPAGTERKFGGRFEIPVDLTKDYQVFFDVLAVRRPVPPVPHQPDPAKTTPLSFQDVPAYEPQRLFRQDVSAGCRDAVGTCTVDISPACDPAVATECILFLTNNESYYAVATRLTVEHKIAGSALPARNISARLSAMRWRIPPHISSFFTEQDAPPDAIQKKVVVYLPTAMGEPDLEYLRIEQGNFANPDTKLNDGGPNPSAIDFKAVLSDEKRNVELTRVRQTIGLCGFADEIFSFLRTHFSESGQPYASDYLNYWRNRIDAYKARCDEARQRLKATQFTEGDRPEVTGTSGLRLPELLQNLPYAQQISSAETLLERILSTFAMGEDFLTDDPRLTRRGYRLPIKVNPLSCDLIAELGRESEILTPITSPIAGPDDKPCAYRISTNFAMQELEDLTDPQTGKRLLDDGQIENIRDMLARFYNSKEAAFNIELTATINGVPVKFRELSGEKTGNEHCTPATTKTCMGNYGTIEPIESYYYPTGNGTTSHGDAFPRVTINKRAGRAVSFSNSIMDDKLPPECERNYPLYRNLGEMEAKQDCLFPKSDITPAEKYVGPETYGIHYTIGENNQFVGRNRVFEFDARPLDVLELHFSLAGAQKTIERNPGESKNTVTGKFSIFNAVDQAMPPPMGLVAGRHLLPRSPSQILPNGDLDLRCPQTPFVPPVPAGSPPGPFPPLEWMRTGTQRLWTTCRPWTRLGWTEVLLGAQYRTYSDAQKIYPGRESNIYSIKRRREILRLQPEIEVAADEYVLEYNRANLPLLEDRNEVAPFQHEVFNRHNPNVIKTGGDWSLFATKAGQEGALRAPSAFVMTPFVVRPPARRAPSLRYDSPTTPDEQPSNGEKRYDNVSNACGTLQNPNYSGCETGVGAIGDTALNLKYVDVLALTHRFVGPTVATAAESAWQNNAADRPKTSVCAAETPSAVASCWKGVDDTVFFESAIQDSAGTTSPLYSVSALVGFERPPLAEFKFQFDAYTKVACIDPENPRNPCLAPIPAAPAPSIALPNRPTPPDPDRAIEVFGPVQTSQSSSVSQNAGAAFVNADGSSTQRLTTRSFQDINGDGFPDVISNGVAELTSPVGLPRRDWWTYFRANPGAATPNFQLQAGDFEQSGHSVSNGVGAGLSASTFAQIARAKSTGSPDPNVDPSFSFSVESGHDERFTELRDLNGDGLADKISGGKVGDPLELHFNTGNGLRATTNNTMTVAGQPMSYNTTHASGFAIRLGFSFGAGSFAAGSGLAHRDAGSQAALMDFTGDGRPDIVVPYDDKGGLMVFPNLGNGFGKGRIHQLTNWISQPPPQVGSELGTSISETTVVDAGALYTFGFDIWIFRVVFTPGVKWARSQTRELLNIRDVNGDGVPDVVAVSGRFLGGQSNNLTNQVHYNPEAKYYLLTGIQNPSGSKWVFQHGLFGNSGPEHGRPVWALTGVARVDGYEPRLQKPGAPLPPDGQDVLLTTYHYDGGYYNRAERQFYGFAIRTSTVWGCDLWSKNDEFNRCIEAVRDGDLTPATLKAAGYRTLQVVKQEFSNKDFLTQGMVSVVR
jgi:hypothetical protein